MAKAMKRKTYTRKAKKKVHPKVSCYDLHSSGEYKRKDMCHNCVNYLDLSPKLKPQCEMGRRHFWCQRPDLNDTNTSE